MKILGDYTLRASEQMQHNRPSSIEFLTEHNVISSITDDMPRIPDQLLDGVAFLYPTKEDAAKNARFGGTAFLVARHAPKASEAMGSRASVPFLISNRHVVWEHSAPVARFNRRDGRGWVIDLDCLDWTPRPSGDDIAATCVWGLINRVETQISAAPYEMLITEEVAAEAEFGVGDEVFMVGRFINHQGREQIKPAVRFGNISMGLEPIKHPEYGRDQISYAVEMRSRSGFSGSPVIVYRAPNNLPLADLPEGHETGWGVLGVDWGHIIDDEGENTWLNGVVPAWKIIELLEEPKLRKAFDYADEHVAKMEDQNGAEIAVATSKSGPLPTEDNPSHEADFNRLVGEAARTPKSDGRT